MSGNEEKPSVVPLVAELKPQFLPRYQSRGKVLMFKSHSGFPTRGLGLPRVVPHTLALQRFLGSVGCEGLEMTICAY